MRLTSILSNSISGIETSVIVPNRLAMNVTTSNLTCAYTFVDDLIKDAVANRTNVTIAAQQCAAICTLGWDTGDPDISGPGVSRLCVFATVEALLMQSSSV